MQPHICLLESQRTHYSVTEMSKIFLSLSKSIQQSTVSKAALRSNNRRTDAEPYSTASNSIFKTFMRAVSVEWLARNADCGGTKRLLNDKNFTSSLETTFSKTLDRKVKLETYNLPISLDQDLVSLVRV